ncbi:MAG: pilin [Gammaproteobacteria bacterium]|nr:pilin [Gammaproteobacteria bacterium]
MKLLKQKQQGLTLLELMVVVTVIGILAAFAIPVYDDYTTRVKVAEGISLAERAKTAVAVYYGDKGSAPADNATAGLPSKTQFRTDYVNSIEVKNGHVIITYLIGALPALDGGTDDDGNQIHNNVLKIAFSKPDDKANILWDCGSTTSPNATSVPDEFLPVDCR